MAEREFNQINYRDERTYKGYEIIFLDGKKLLCKKYNKDGSYRFALIENNHEYLLNDSCFLETSGNIFNSIDEWYNRSFKK